METQVPLSVVILTKNESSRIGDCIQSVAWADDILVVDDESTDDTVAIARALGARVLSRKMDIEGRHRNWAQAQAKHDWVLSLDADERLTPALAREIIDTVTSCAAYELYAIPRRNYIGGRWLRHGGWYPSAQVKLFKKSRFRWEETTVHPRAFAEGACGQLRHDLIHFSYRDRADFLRKLERQTTLEAEKWIADGRRMRAGKALWRTVDRAIRAYVLKAGFLDGRLGWFAAWMAGRYQWLSYVKYVKMLRAAAGATGTQRAPTQATATPSGPETRMTPAESAESQDDAKMTNGS